jgi:hypothetical protein
MIVKEIINSWKEEIEEINIKGYSRKVESIDCFRMSKLYTGYPDLTDCFKVNFNFEDGIQSYNPCSEILLESKEISQNKDDWNLELERTFINKFGTPIETTQYGNIKFENDVCDYMVNQGYRFIIQFYLPGLIAKLRQEKLKQLIN